LLYIEGRKAEGWPLVVREKIGAFVNSTAITLAILLAASTAFVVTCAPMAACIIVTTDMDRAEPGIVVGCIAGTVAAIFVIYQLGRRLWPRKD
jgi:hypothetical protein